MYTPAQARMMANLIINHRRKYDQVAEEDRPLVDQALIDRGYGYLIPQPPVEPDEPEFPEGE